MNSKAKFFSEFLIEWIYRYEKFKDTLLGHSTFSEVSCRIKNFRFIEANDLDQLQVEWIWVLSQLENPIDFNFLKSYWVPVNADKYNIFIDLSVPEFELFEIDYFNYEPYQWIKFPLIRDINQFTLSVDVDMHLIDIEKAHTEKIKSEIKEKLFLNRFKLGYQGKLDYKKNDYFSGTIFPDDSMILPRIENGDGSITITGVNALAICILPGHLNITLGEIVFEKETDINSSKIITNINGFVFLLRHSEYEQIKSYSFTFDDCPIGYAWFMCNKLYITHSDNNVLAEAKKNLIGLSMKI